MEELRKRKHRKRDWRKERESICPKRSEGEQLVITSRFRSPQFIPTSLIPSAPGERNPFLPTINDAHALSGSPETFSPPLVPTLYSRPKRQREREREEDGEDSCTSGRQGVDPISRGVGQPLSGCLTFSPGESLQREGRRATQRGEIRYTCPSLVRGRRETETRKTTGLKQRAVGCVGSIMENSKE